MINFVKDLKLSEIWIEDQGNSVDLFQAIFAFFFFFFKCPSQSREMVVSK